MRNNPQTLDVQLDWGEPSKVVRFDVDQDKARVLGVSSQEISFQLNTLLSGLRITEYREKNKLIEVLGRGEAEDRKNPAQVDEIKIQTRTGKAVPLSQLVKIDYSFGRKRDHLATRSVSDFHGTFRYSVGIQAPEVTAAIDPLLDPIRAKLPDGYRIDIGGAAESSKVAQDSISAVMPVMLFTLVTF